MEKLARTAQGRSPYNGFPNKGKRRGRPEGRAVVRHGPDKPKAGKTAENLFANRIKSR
jgi:hypothetical protein